MSDPHLRGVLFSVRIDGNAELLEQRFAPEHSLPGRSWSTDRRRGQVTNRRLRCLSDAAWEGLVTNLALCEHGTC